MRPDVARRVASAASVAALAGAIAYVVERAWFHLVLGSQSATIVLREQRVNYHLALVIALFVGVASGLCAGELARTEARVEALERSVERAALPVLLVLCALVFLWP